MDDCRGVKSSGRLVNFKAGIRGTSSQHCQVGQSKRSERSLLLEDDDVLRESLQELLGDEGYTVVTASSGEEAVGCRIAKGLVFEGLSGCHVSVLDRSVQSERSRIVTALEFRMQNRG